MPTTLKEYMHLFLQNLIIEIGDEEMCAKSLMPGASILGEYVSDCGAMAWVRLMSANFTQEFPAPTARANACAESLAIPVEVGIIRTAPMIKETARKLILPTSEEQAAAADKQYDDLEAIRRMLARSSRQVEDFVAGQYTPMGPETGVVGGSWTFTFGMD